MDISDYKVAIIGGGYGLYGYLPALCHLGARNIRLPHKHYEKIKQRPDLNIFLNNIKWVSSLEEAVTDADTVIVAVPPQAQLKLLPGFIKLSNINKLVLEKPLCPTPKQSQALLDQLINSGKQFSIGYNFRFTDWAKRIITSKQTPIEICWNFKAHHYENDLHTWKREHRNGGGPIRFYGIHLIAFLSELGFNNVKESRLTKLNDDDFSSWDAKFINNASKVCSVKINTFSNEKNFSIKTENSSNGKQVHVGLEHPFDENMSKSTEDDRAPYIERLLQDFSASDTLKSQQKLQHYVNTLKLWENCEESV